MVTDSSRYGWLSVWVIRIAWIWLLCSNVAVASAVMLVYREAAPFHSFKSTANEHASEAQRKHDAHAHAEPLSPTSPTSDVMGFKQS